MYFLMSYNHSMTEQEAAERKLPAEVDVVISEDRDAGLLGDALRPWQMARSPEATPPAQMFMFIDKAEWNTDFFTIYGGVVASERFLALLNAWCAGDFYASRLIVIDHNDRELSEILYFVKFTTVADVLDFDRLDFGGAYHEVIGGPNDLSEDDRGVPLVKRAADIVFINDKPAIFLEGNLPEVALPLFCSESFKAECEGAGIRGPWFSPETELLVVDFRPGWGDQFEEAKAQLITKAQRRKWRASVDRSLFSNPDTVQLSPEHQEILRMAAERLKNKR